VTFKAGISGNPKGRPPGSGYRQLLTSQAPELIQKTIDLALDGNEAALRICIDRIVPAFKAEAPAVVMGGIEGTLTEQGTEILRALEAGEITPDHGVKLLQGLQALTAVKSASELECRIEALETAVLKKHTT
jgi:hypothetical protein